MKPRRMLQSTAAVAAAAAFAACAGPLHGFLPAKPDANSPRAPHRAARAAPLHARVRIHIPKAPSSGVFSHAKLPGGRANPFFTASTTKGISIVVTQGATTIGTVNSGLTASANGCSSGSTGLTCNIQVPALAGTDKFTFTTYDAPPVSGSFTGIKALGYGFYSRTITEGTDNVLPPVTLGGIVSSIFLDVPIGVVHGTLPSKQTVAPNALDADGNVIVGTDQYYNAAGTAISVNLGLNKIGTAAVSGAGGGSFTLSAVTLNSPPANGVQLSYDGAETVPAGTNDGAFSVTVLAQTSVGGIKAPNATVKTIGPTFTVYPLPTPSTHPAEITSTSDGSIYFTDPANDRVWRWKNGAFKAMKVTAGSKPYGITSDQNGTVYFGEQQGGKVGWISGTTATECTTSNFQDPEAFTYDANDNHVYVADTSLNAIERVTISSTTAYCAKPTPFPITTPTGANQPVHLTVGPDKNVWFTQGWVDYVGSIGTDGSPVLSKKVSGTGNCTGNGVFPDKIAAGSDGDLWVTTNCDTRVVRLTTSGALTRVTVGEKTHGVTGGPDGNVWVVGYSSGLFRIDIASPSNPAVTHYGFGTASGGIGDVTVGSDLALWFTNAAGYLIRFQW